MKNLYDYQKRDSYGPDCTYQNTKGHGGILTKINLIRILHAKYCVKGVAFIFV